MCELGERLRRAREEKGLSLKEAARRLALKASVLEALEECRFQDLPEPPLARGYLRRYARLLGLDPEPLLALYPLPKEPPLPPPPPRWPSLWPWALALVLLFGLLAFGAFRLLVQPRPEVVEVSLTPLPETPARYTLRLETDPPGARAYLDGFLLGETPLTTPPLEGGRRLLRLERPGYLPLEQEINLDRNLSLRLGLVPQGPPAEPPSPPAREATLVLKLEGRSWLRVRQGDKVLYEGIPEVGSSLSFPLPVEVRAGNPGGVRVILQGQDLGPMGEPGRPVTRTFPAP